MQLRALFLLLAVAPCVAAAQESEILGLLMKDNWRGSFVTFVHRAEQARPVLLRALEDKDPIVRQRSVRVLREIDFRDPAHGHIPYEERDRLKSALVLALSKSARDPHPDVRAEAIEALVYALRDGGDQISRSTIEPLLALGKSAVPVLIKVLRAVEQEPSELSAPKSTACAVLYRLRDERAADALIHVIESSKGYVLLHAFGALAQLEDPRVVPMLIDRIDVSGGLMHTTPPAFAYLFMMRPTPTRQLVYALQHHPRASVRKGVARVFTHVEVPEAVPALQRALKDESPEVRYEAVEALRINLHPTSGQFLISCLTDPDTGVQLAAIDTLASLKYQPAFAKLSGLLASPDLPKRTAAVLAIAEIDGVRALSHLLPRLNDEDLRPILPRALGAINAPEAEKALIYLLENGDDKVRNSAAAALADWPTKESIEALVQVCREVDSAAVSLSKIGPKAADALIANWKELGPDEGLVLALARTKDTRVFDLLLPHALSGPFRSKAIEAFGVLGDTRGVPICIAALKDRDESVRIVAAEALGSLGDGSAVPALLEALEDPKTKFQAGASLALIGDPSTIERVLKLAREDSIERWMILEALGNFKDERVFSLLIEEVERERQASSAIKALSKLGDLRALPTLREAIRSDNLAVHYEALAAIALLERR